MTRLFQLHTNAAQHDHPRDRQSKAAGQLSKVQRNVQSQKKLVSALDGRKPAYTEHSA
jgi:hypothetical protein